MEEQKLLLQQIKIGLDQMENEMWKREDWEQLKFVMDMLEARIQNMMDCTMKNLQWFQEEGWRKFFEGES